MRVPVCLARAWASAGVVVVIGGRGGWALARIKLKYCEFLYSYIFFAPFRVRYDGFVSHGYIYIYFFFTWFFYKKKNFVAPRRHGRNYLSSSQPLKIIVPRTYTLVIALRCRLVAKLEVVLWGGEKGQGHEMKDKLIHRRAGTIKATRMGRKYRKPKCCSGRSSKNAKYRNSGDSWKISFPHYVPFFMNTWMIMANTGKIRCLFDFFYFWAYVFTTFYFYFCVGVHFFFFFFCIYVISIMKHFSN